MLRRLIRLLAVALLALGGLSCAPAGAAKDSYTEGLTAYRAAQYTKAYRLLLPLARKNDARAMYLVGVMYESGHSVPQDDTTAAGWFAASAKRGYASGQYSLARLTIEGRGVAKSREKGTALLAAAAAQGHKEAMALLERIDPALAAAAAIREPAMGQAAPAGDFASGASSASASGAAARPAASASAPAAAARGAKPVAVAFTKLERPLAQASLEAMRGVLLRLALADNPELRRLLPVLAQDFARQYWHIESVGDVRLASAYTQLVREHIGTLSVLALEMAAAPAPAPQAVSGLLSNLISVAGATGREGCAATIKAAQGNFSFAWFQGARCIATANAEQAGDWMLMAAAAGHAGAQESAGRACIEAAAKDWACAKEWLGRAAEAGRSSAMPALAWTLANQPQVTETDQRTALDWYEAAATAGDTVSMNNLAAMLERGPAAVRDPARARDWYARAARSGFGPAQLNLGRMLAQGEGGAVNRDEADEWLRKAEAAGVEEARALREQIAR